MSTQRYNPIWFRIQSTYKQQRGFQQIVCRQLKEI